MFVELKRKTAACEKNDSLYNNTSASTCVCVSKRTSACAFLCVRLCMYVHVRSYVFTHGFSHVLCVSLFLPRGTVSQSSQKQEEKSGEMI